MLQFCRCLYSVACSFSTKCYFAAISRVFDCLHQEIDAIDVVEGEGEDGDSEDINGTPMPPTPPLVTGNEGSGNESADEKEEDNLIEPEGK